jgi:hypothetical protein
MPEKIINFDVDENSGNFELKLEGFKGKGCKDIAKLFEKIGKVTTETHTPDFQENNATVTVKAGH